MSRQAINIGSAGGDGTGNPLRTGGGYINSNFTEVYDMLLSNSIIAGEYAYAAPYATLNAGAAPSSASMYLFPVIIRRNCTLSEICTYVTTANAGQTFGIAVYAHNWTTNKPTGTNLANTGTSLSAAATGSVIGAISGGLALTPGVYWIAFQTSASTAVWQVGNASSTFVPSLLSSSTLSNIVGGAQAPASGLTVTNTFGTWPDLTSATFAYTQSARTPAYIFKYSAVS